MRKVLLVVHRPNEKWDVVFKDLALNVPAKSLEDIKKSTSIVKFTGKVV